MTQPLPLNASALKILEALSRGLSDQDIAETLHYSIHTVKWYNRQIFSVLGATSRSHAVALAREAGLFGVGPSGGTTAIGHLPVPPTTWVGREAELEELGRRLPLGRLMTLTGPPGVGKTRLGLELAHRVADQFPDGAWFVPLAAVPDAARVIPALADALGIGEVRGQTRHEALASALADRRILVVLDNCEHVLGSGPHLSRLLSRAPGLGILATSRECLGLYGEEVYPVGPLSPAEAQTLFRERSRSAGGRAGSDGDDDVVAALCHRLDDLPLAIELAAARTKVWTPHHLLQRLDRRFEVLKAPRRDAEPRHASLDETVSWSFQALSKTERDLLERLSLVAGALDWDEAEATWGPELDDPFSSTLEALIDKSLVQVGAGPEGAPELTLLETIREFALRAGDGPDLDRVRDQLAARYAALAGEAEADWRRREGDERLPRFRRADPFLRFSLAWLLGRADPGPGVRMANALRDYWIATGRFAEGRKWADQALALRAGCAPRDRARALVAAALLAHHAGVDDRLDQKLAWLDEAWADSESDPGTRAWLLTTRGALGVGGPPVEGAWEATVQATDLFRQLGDPAGQAQAHCVAAELARGRGDDALAEDECRACLALVDQTGESRRESMLWTNLGYLARRRGAIAEAEDLFRRGLAKAVEFGHDAQLLASPVVALAAQAARSGDATGARDLAGAALRILRDGGLPAAPGDQLEIAQDLAVVRGPWDEQTWQDLLAGATPLSGPQLLARVSRGPVVTGSPAPPGPGLPSKP